MMKYAVAVAALLAGPASAFVPAQQPSSVSTALYAERSTSLPFMNRPKLVSYRSGSHCLARTAVLVS